jgi:hypothetical protein
MSARYAGFLVALSMVVWSCEAPGVTAASAQAPPLVLRVGETSRADGTDLVVTFDAVRSDSRCPKDVRCIQAGEAVVALTVRVAGGEENALILAVPPGGGASAVYGPYTVSVVSLEPQTQAQVDIAQSEYRVTVSVGER